MTASEALKARNRERHEEQPIFFSRFQRLAVRGGPFPGPRAQAVTKRAVGALKMHSARTFRPALPRCGFNIWPCLKRSPVSHSFSAACVTGNDCVQPPLQVWSTTLLV